MWFGRGSEHGVEGVVMDMMEHNSACGALKGLDSSQSKMTDSEPAVGTDFSV